MLSIPTNIEVPALKLTAISPVAPVLKVVAYVFRHIEVYVGKSKGNLKGVFSKGLI